MRFLLLALLLPACAPTGPAPIPADMAHAPYCEEGGFCHDVYPHEDSCQRQILAGVPMPDGTPCELYDATTLSVCAGGHCTTGACIGRWCQDGQPGAACMRDRDCTPMARAGSSL